jgi:hypothetical protein
MMIPQILPSMIHLHSTTTSQGLSIVVTTGFCKIFLGQKIGLWRPIIHDFWLCGPLETKPFLLTDNGPSFMAKRFCRHIQNLYSHVRIRYRTPTQLGLLARLNRTLKEEEVYWRLYDNPFHVRQCLGEFRRRYNRIRPQWALVPQQGGDPMTPYDVYVEGKAIGISKWQGWAKAAKAKLDKMMTEEAP